MLYSDRKLFGGVEEMRLQLASCSDKQFHGLDCGLKYTVRDLKGGENIDRRGLIMVLSFRKNFVFQLFPTFPPIDAVCKPGLRYEKSKIHI